MAEFSIIVPTKDRLDALLNLLDSFRKLRRLERIQPEIIIGDNSSADDTWEMLQRESPSFPVELRLIRVTTPGKSAVMNEAIRAASGKILAFVDDDVIVDPGWLESIDHFLENNPYQIAQGAIHLPSPEAEDPQIKRLLDRYRTIPHLDYGPAVQTLDSLNGANLVIYKEVFNRIGHFDQRLGPGAAGTSEDVELARRIVRAGFKIGYMREAIVYHRVERSRLTDEYFKSLHRRQGFSRLAVENRGITRITLSLVRSSMQYCFYSLVGRERKRYRSKGRIYHYLAMLEAKAKTWQDS
jgi:glucosyl-dolichyl phosphate glucuronosyltransferase